MKTDDMRSVLKYLLFVLILFAFSNIGAQQISAREQAPEYTIRGSVRESDTYKPIPRVNIEINGGAYTRTNFDGSFLIRARKGDELVIRHKDFETVYYTIENDDRITVEVEPADDVSNLKDKAYKKDIKSFNSIIDSVAKYKKENVEKSIAFVGEALSQSSSQTQNAEAYLVLAEVYMHWKQYDLAVSNYRVSLQNKVTNQAKLGLGKAYDLNQNYQESLETYKTISTNALNNYQSIMLYEGIGDTYFNIKNFDAAIISYKKGLDIAKRALISSKEADLNSKLAQVYNANGKADKAEEFFGNSMDLASKQTKKRALEEKETVAEFRNNNQNYSEEIELRKEIVKDVAGAERDSVIDNSSALTSQKQNYKIGNAYFLQQNYAKAIPYLEKSIKEANAKEDLVVKKDATRKLSDVYVSAGDFEKAKTTFEEYKLVVDALYLKREQELSQADRFRRSISEQQNRITSLESDRKLTSSLANERSKNQQLIIYSLIVATLLLCITAFFMYKYIKQQRLANNLLALKSLRSQMNPHFIFNALNSVNSFIAMSDERTANKYLSDFSLLMRAVLENSEEDFIPLQKEIELLQLYTKLEHFRFKDKFDYEINVDPEVEVAAYQIPPMLLQPYIENAVWHGLRYKTEKGQLQILIERKTENEITISILDDGIGRARSKELKTAHQQRQNSKGMGNIKKRVAILNDMYKDKVDVNITDHRIEDQDTGTQVVVTLRKD